MTPRPVKVRREIHYHADVERMKKLMLHYFNGQLPEPDDDITAKVLKAAGDASIDDIYAHLRYLRQHGHQPGTGAEAPKGYGWILWAVRRKFQGIEGKTGGTAVSGAPAQSSGGPPTEPDFPEKPE